MKKYQLSGKQDLFQKEFQSNESFQNEQFKFLIVTDLENFRTTYISKILTLYCGCNVDAILNGLLDFQEELIHPDDRLAYTEHLEACRELKTEEKREISIRLLDKHGQWAEFCFKDRIYQWSPNGEKKALISQVFKVPSELLSKNEQAPCETTSEKQAPTDKYQRLLDSIDEAYCIIELIFNLKGEPVDYLFTETNPAFEDHVNLKNVTGKTIREIIPDFESHWFETFGKVALTGEPVRFQQYGEKLGKEWFDLYAFKIGGENSRRVAVLFHNITQRKLTEETLLKTQKELEERAQQRQEELRENSELLQSVFDNTNLAIAVFKAMYDSTGKVIDFLFVRVNKVLKEMYLQQDPIGHSYKETSKYGVEMGILDGFLKVMETGEVMDKEFFFDKDGYNHWFKVIARRQNNLLIASIEDISARKAETLKLREIMRFNKQLVQTSPDTILIFNLNDFKVRYINQDLLKRAGMTKERIKGMGLAEMLPYLHPRDREKLIGFHKKILKSQDDDILETEFRIKLKGTEWEWFNARGKIFSRKNENWVDEYVMLVRNITEQKLTQRSLINAERLSIQGEVARTFAHELRNPLASIRMATDVLQHKMEEPQKELLKNYFDILSRSTNVLNNLVSNLLNASNYSPVTLRKIDLGECVNQTLEMAADRIYLAGIKVTRKYRGPYYILGDAEKLKIALLNIVVNASEATTPGEGLIQVDVKKVKTDYLLRIIDNGHGLEKDQITRLFDAFYTNKATGSGIGLTSVKNILEEHYANIKVLSTPGEGTTFEILFHNAEME